MVTFGENKSSLGNFAGSASVRAAGVLNAIEGVSQMWRTIEIVDAQYRRSSRLYASGWYLFVVLLQALEKTDGDADAPGCSAELMWRALRWMWRDDCRAGGLGRKVLFCEIL